MRSMLQRFGAAFCILAITAAAAWAADPALPYGINAHLPSSALLDRVAAAGIAWIRVDFNWFMMEPARGVYDWTLTDAVVGDARARGLNVYATLAYAPAWANGNQAPNTPPGEPPGLVCVRLYDRQPLPRQRPALGHVERTELQVFL